MKDNQLIKLFALSSTQKLGEKVSQHIGIPITPCTISRFSDGEFQIRIDESIRGCDVFVIQSTSYPVNENIMELFIMVDALKRASAKTINVVIPYFGYARQDRKAFSREPITSKLVANLLQKLGVMRLLTVDLHAPQIQGFFDIPVDPLQGIPVLATYFKQKNVKDLVVVAPNSSGVARARKMAAKLNVPMAFIDKHRSDSNGTKKMNIVGDTKGKNIIIIDDIIDTAETITDASRVLKGNGAEEIYACCTHPVFSEGAVDKIAESDIGELVVTDTIPLDDIEKLNKITVQTMAPLLGEAISRIYNNIPVGDLFD